MYYYLYKITNINNGKYYIGARTSKLEPVFDVDYLGSGKGIKKAISKYGKENFIKQILVICPSKEYVFNLEKLYITEDVINDRQSYNMRSGGYGGTSSIDWTDERKFACKKGANNTYTTRPEVKEKISKSVRKLFEEKGKDYWSEEGRKRMGDAGRTNGLKNKGKKFSPRKSKILDTSRMGKYLVTEKMREDRRKVMLKMLEENNPMNSIENRKKVGDSKLGRRKMRNSAGVGKYVKAEEQSQYELDGWVFCTPIKI